MNNDRRKALKAIETTYQGIENDLEEMKNSLESLRDEEQEYYDNMSENLKSSEKAEISQNAINSIEAALEAIDTMVNEFPGNLSDAME